MDQTNQTTPSMADFEDEINRSFRSLKEGDFVNCTIIGITDTEILVDLGSYTEGLIPISELSYDPHYSYREELSIGQSLKASVIKEDDGEGNVVLSLKQALDILAWDELTKDLTAKTKYQVKIQSVVNGGVITYLKGMRAFIPASQLSLSYVEHLEDWVNKTVEVIVITADEDKKKLVLSAKEVEKEKASLDHESKLSKLQKGIVTTGIVEKIAPYGAFVSIGDDLTGLVHISQICGHHIKSPNEVLKLEQEVKVKILDIHDGKISLSIKAVAEEEAVVSEVEDVAVEYLSDETAGTSLGNLLSKFKL